MNAIVKLADLIPAARAVAKERGVLAMAVLAPTELKHIEASVQASEEGIARPVFVGNPEQIGKLAAMDNIDISPYEIISSQEPLNDVAAPVIEKKVGLLLSAGISDRRLAIELFGKSSGGSHIALLQTPRYHKLLYLTDSAVNSEMDINRWIAIIENAAAVARKFGITTPKVALLAAVEAINPSMPVTIEEAAISKMAERGQIKNALVDGPLSFDVAMSAEVAHHKGIKNSPVAGDPDIFVAPTIETANGIYKAMTMYGGAESAGVIVGGRVPIATAFTVDSVRNVLNSIALAALLASK